MFENLKKYLGFASKKTIAANELTPIKPEEEGVLPEVLSFPQQRGDVYTEKGRIELKKHRRIVTASKMKFLDKRKKTIIKNIEEGIPYGQIAKKHGVCIATFDKWRAQNNLKK